MPNIKFPEEDYVVCNVKNEKKKKKKKKKLMSSFV